MGLLTVEDEENGSSAGEEEEYDSVDESGEGNDDESICDGKIGSGLEGVLDGAGAVSGGGCQLGSYGSWAISGCCSA
jgi:hypothetical protein